MLSFKDGGVYLFNSEDVKVKKSFSLSLLVYISVLGAVKCGTKQNAENKVPQLVDSDSGTVKLTSGNDSLVWVDYVCVDCGDSLRKRIFDTLVHQVNNRLKLTCNRPETFIPKSIHINYKPILNAMDYETDSPISNLIQFEVYATGVAKNAYNTSKPVDIKYYYLTWNGYLDDTIVERIKRPSLKFIESESYNEYGELKNDISINRYLFAGTGSSSIYISPSKSKYGSNFLIVSGIDGCVDDNDVMRIEFESGRHVRLENFLKFNYDGNFAVQLRPGLYKVFKQERIISVYVIADSKMFGGSVQKRDRDYLSQLVEIIQ